MTSLATLAAELEAESVELGEFSALASGTRESYVAIGAQQALRDAAQRVHALGEGPSNETPKEAAP